MESISLWISSSNFLNLQYFFHLTQTLDFFSILDQYSQTFQQSVIETLSRIRAIVEMDILSQYFLVLFSKQLNLWLKMVCFSTILFGKVEAFPIFCDHFYPFQVYAILFEELGEKLSFFILFQVLTIYFSL